MWLVANDVGPLVLTAKQRARYNLPTADSPAFDHMLRVMGTVTSNKKLFVSRVLPVASVGEVAAQDTFGAQKNV